ncbi:CopL family metal-binding regulatory protein [Arenimonas metalli]|uniref:CopL family metal-binding regulatory protein n=1 Tax=Arenimonas metalli CF5-1 TaxID=1384056 RepID=A0A091B6H9_9GAMM|nr:CopL family metal-binding regulatory protein [Arenimonas metalli]KFN47102.1 hypothetical protein N787_02015 [Arenimonas metalli CF5-1]
MPLLRTLAHLMLVLALLAGGFAPGGVAAQGFADAGAAQADAGMAGSCHDLAGDPVGPPESMPTDCCEGGCTCDCVNPMQAGLLAAPSRATLPVRGAVQRPFAAVRLSASATPDIRPPIA